MAGRHPLAVAILEYCCSGCELSTAQPQSAVGEQMKVLCKCSPWNLCVDRTLKAVNRMWSIIKTRAESPSRRRTLDRRSKVMTQDKLAGRQVNT